MQNNADTRQVIILSVLLLFVSMWLYTEVVEYQNRTRFVEEVNDFMQKGDRYTKEDAKADRAALMERVNQLEKARNGNQSTEAMQEASLPTSEP